jgi:hypothetical protein
MKNRTTKVALILLALVLATTCIVGSTFARYITSEDIEDDGRVGRWGVEITTAGHLFAEQYQDYELTAGDSSITVQVANAATVEQNVVAPGTRNDTGISLSLEGTPEVDVRVTINVETTDIVLKYFNDQGADINYIDPTVGNGDAVFTLAEIGKDYYPVEFTLVNGAGVALLDKVNLATVEAFFEGMSGVYNSNTNLASGATYGNGVYELIDGTYTLVWKWDFDKIPGTVDVYDKADTFIGNQGGFVENVNDPNLLYNDVVFNADNLQDIKFDISITVEQID